MKTSELRRILSEDCVEGFSESEHSFYSVYWTVWKKKQRLVVRGFVPLGIITTLGKYHNTPISEREDEKKYRIVVGSSGFKDIEYLTLIVNRKKYYFSVFNGNEELYQRIFTQQEIYNFPAEIKGAIECGFLRKVEVE